MILTKEEELHSLLRLVSVPGIGSFRIRQLVKTCKSAKEVFNTDLLSLTEIAGIDKTLAQSILKQNNPRFADEQIRLCRKNRIRILTYFCSSYPANLKEIHDPPVLLYVKGDILPEDSVALGVVGTRHPSDYGKRITEKVTRELINNGFSIISGLARGVDTIAHRVCVQFGSRTIAVLGSGLDVIYPSENKKLASRIELNGAVLSELPCGSQPDAANFPKRNRIISGLSFGVLVIEAGSKSGALITADMALNQNREVFAIPGSLFNPKSVGTNRLIKEGAKLVQSVEDILVELDGRIKSISSTQSQISQLPEGLSETERRIVATLSEEPRHIDWIAQEAGLSTAETLSVLLTLELKNIVKQLTGKRFVRV